MPIRMMAISLLVNLQPFTIKHVNAVAGIMITASHNPRADNGYKVYGSNGAQIVSPADEHISAMIQVNLKPRSWDADAHRTSPLCSSPNDAFDAYFKLILEQTATRRKSALFFLLFLLN